MLERLPASRSARHERPWVAAASIAFHAGVVILAVQASGWSAPAPTSDREPVTLVYHAPPPSPREHRAIARGLTSSSGGTRAPDAPPIVAPIDVPTGLTPPDPKLVILEPVAGFGSGTAMGVSRDSGRAGAVATADVLDERSVDRVVVPLGGTPAPRYPDLLRAAGVEGTVSARFVVDTLGRFERGSLRVSDTSHPLFVQAVSDALARTHYLPAEAGGRRVRQLVEQSFVFRIAPR